MSRLISVLVVAWAAALFVGATAAAKPRMQQVELRFGIVAELTGSGCSPATLARPTDGDTPVAFVPAVGDDVGFVDSVLVTEANLGGGQASWTVQPTAEECAFNADNPSWTWSTDERSWAVTHRTPAYAIRASRHGGVRSIAGFRVSPRTRMSAPTIRKARRHFGRPSSVRRRYRVACRARWDRLGLTIDFLNLGGQNPCRRGFVQAGHVSGTAAQDWTAVVATDPGVARGTTDAFLENELIGEPGETSRVWTLADVFTPYGDSGYIPSLSALLSRSGAVRGFKFWVGAGGD